MAPAPKVVTFQGSVSARIIRVLKVSKVSKVINDP